MKNTAICIVTRGRPDNQITLKHLPPKVLKNTYLVVDSDEYHAHRRYRGKVKKVLKFPKGWGNLDGCTGDKKEWLKNKIEKKYLFFLDDDISFCIRKDMKIKNANNLETLRMFKLMLKFLEEGKFAQVAISPRGGNNRVVEDYRDNTRATCVCGFNLDLIKSKDIKFNRILLMSDFDTTLSVLTSGLRNRTIYSFAFNARDNNAEGGCSVYRTPKTMTESAHNLKKLHPRFVKVLQKKSSKPWKGFKTNVRTDVQISWRKAYDFGKAKGSKGITTFFKK